MADLSSSQVEGRPVRTFPSDLAVIDRAATVDVTYRNRRVLTGTVAGRPVELVVGLPVSTGSARGRFRTVEITASWRIAEDPRTLDGMLGATAATLEGHFPVDADHGFGAGDVTGTCGADAVRLRVERADGGLSGASVYAEGAIGSTGWSLWATVASDRREGMVVGVIGGQPVQLRATKDGDHLHITGVCDGPDLLLLILLGGLAYFM